MLGAYQVRAAQSEADFAAVMALRRARFGVGADAYDGQSQQVMILAQDKLLACYRLGAFASGADLARSYAAQFYDLSGLRSYARPALEMGRFCMAAGLRGEADVLRLAFASLAQRVDGQGAGLLFGCASFMGSDPAPHLPSLALLRAHISGQWHIGHKSAQVIDLHSLPPPANSPDALRAMPPLLRSYLALGGWVGGHAVRDFALGTIHVFTAVEVDKIPHARAAALRSLGAQIDEGGAKP